MKILIIEDERALADALAEIFKHNMYMSDRVYDGEDGLEYALTGNYDIIILDLMLPKLNGLDVLKSIRAEGIQTPVLLLTAKSETSDKVSGLDAGADDYLTKPFATAELLARVRALTRRKGEFTGDDISFGDITLNKNLHELLKGSTSIKLGGKEYEIMEMLFMNPKQIIRKERFAEKIWGYDSDTEYNNIEVYVSFLRKKLLMLHSHVEIKAVRGVGYCLRLPNDKEASN